MGDMMKKIVVPLDGSSLAERALSPACALAHRLDASLVLLTTHWADGIGSAEEYLEGQSAELGYARTGTIVVHDRFAAEAILLSVREADTVVCMSTHGRSGLGHAVLGSVAEEVLRNSDRPLLLVGPELERGAWESAQWFRGGRLIVALDGSARSERIVPVAAKWARLLGLGIELTQVLITPLGFGLRDEDSGDAAQVALEEIAASIDAATKPACEVLHGPDVAASLLDHASRAPATLIALTTHGRTGLARVTLGSVAMQVVRRSPCPVLTLHTV
jgi:nucleotide-binding universal stress UspA family protein